MHIGEPLTSWTLLLARTCLASVFLVSGVHKALYYGKAEQEFRDAGARPVGLFLPLTIAFHLLAPLALIAGIRVTEVALALAAFTVIATLKVHTFWRMSGEARLARSRIAMAHLAIVGGLLALAITGPGAFRL